MKNISRYFLLIFPLAILFASGCASLKSTSGKGGMQPTYTMNPGQSFTMKSEGSTDITTENMGGPIRINMNSGGEIACRANSIAPDGNIDFEMEYKVMKQSAKTPMGENETDFSSWIGKRVQFNVSPHGALSNFRGFDQLPEITSASGEKVNGELIQKGISSQFPELPDHPVKPGESWTVTNSRDIPYGGGTLNQNESTTYTFVEKVKRDGMDCLKIEAAGTEKLTGEFEQQGTQLEITRETKSSGVIYFALEKGMYVSMELSSSATGQIYVQTASITIPQEIKGRISVTVIWSPPGL